MNRMEYLNGISCIIVGYRSLDYLEECIESIRRQKGVAFEIVVVDNDSRDGTDYYLNKLDTKNILLDENRGFGTAVNLGAKKAEYKHLFILNPDTIVPPDSLKKLFRFAELKADYGLIAPALEYPDGRPQISARKLPRRRDFLLSRGSPLYRLGITGEKEGGYIVPDAGDSIEIPAVSATAILIKTELFNEMGGFDERFFMYMEDIDLCRRIRDRGLPVILVPGVRIKHSWRKSSSKKPFFSAYHHHLSVLKYFSKYDKNRIVMNFLMVIVVAAGFIFSVVLIFGKKVFCR
ncbi:MAG: glycosyltransferase family 2 protein [Candidatus Zixiibacteriota bacterium]|nr:MAG: glycosyltransferase family 2 protein [candidate division Zixibacteria bacterium]